MDNTPIKILITGKNSYVGKSFKKWVEQWPEQYEVEMISVRDDEWQGYDFSKFDSVLHVAGVAHIKETSRNQELYYTVNRDLAYKVAKKAKADGVKQFIFLSSMSVYGIESGVINEYSIPNPKSNYGKSKLQAEKLLSRLESDDFMLAIIRPPMIYGEECTGNYVRLKKLILRIPIFPNIENKRSVIYIRNFSEFIKILVNQKSKGLYLPQNAEYMCTSTLVKLVADSHGKKL